MCSSCGRKSNSSVSRDGYYNMQARRGGALFRRPRNNGSNRRTAAAAAVFRASRKNIQKRQSERLFRERGNNIQNDFFGNSMSYRWSTPTWHFFHSFAAKVHEDFYRTHTREIFGIITKICQSLPCPDCQRHANRFFKNINYRQYPSKESFRRLLLNFHNAVNKTTRKASLLRSNISKYDFSNFFVITNQFLRVFGSYKARMGGGFSDSRRREKVIKDIRGWINNHHKNFL